MAKESIGDLVVGISADISDLVNGFAKTASHIRDIQKAVADVNFEQMRKNISVTARVIQSLRTQTVNGFHDVDLSVRRVVRTLEKTNKLLSQMGMGVSTNNIVNNVNNINRTYNRLGRTMQYAGTVGSKSLHQISGGFGFLGSVLGSHSRIMKAFSHSFVDGLALMSAEFWILEMAARTAYRVLLAFPTKAIKAVDEYRLSVIKTQALISTFSPKDIDFGISFENASKYARDLVTEMDILAAYTLGTSFDLQAITQEFMKQGVLIDINNAKAKDAFLNIANAIEIIASGFQAVELQIRQESRALAMGQVDLRATLATELNARLGGQLKERIALWKQEGTFIQNIGDLLQGYAASIKDIRNTWKSISALFKTMSDRIIRFGSEEFYEAVNKQLRRMTDYLQEHEVLITGRVYAGWRGLLTIMSSIKRSYQTLEEPIWALIDASALFLHGWKNILVGFLPVALERVSLILRGMYDLVLATVGAWMVLGSAMKEVMLTTTLFGWDFTETKKALAEMKPIFKDLSQSFKMGLTPISEEINRRIMEFDTVVDEFKQGLGRKPQGTPQVMPMVDRDKFESELSAFLNGASIKTSRWLEEESRKIEKHREELIRNKILLIQDEAAMVKHALSVGSNITPGGDFLGGVISENSPFIRFKPMGIQQWLKEYIKIINDATRQTKEFTDDINAIADVQKWEAAIERAKTTKAPAIAISQRYSGPLQKEMSALTEFIKAQQFEIKKLSRLGLLSQSDADNLLLGLDRNAIAERGRIVEESYQKIKEELAKFDSFIADRTGGQNSLLARIAKENEDLARSQRELSRIYTQGLILKKDYDKKTEEMSNASSQRKILIEEQFNSEMLSKQLSLRQSQLKMAETELTMSRASVARERLILSQQELTQELKILDTLSRIEGIGSLAWSEQREKVEELRSSIAELGQTVRETTGTFGQGMKYAMQKYVRDSNSEFEGGVQMINDSASGMTSWLETLFNDFRTRDIKSWQEYLSNLVSVFAQAAQKIVAEMLMMKLFSMILGFGMGGLGSLAGGGGKSMGTMGTTSPASGYFATNNLSGVRRVPGESGLSSSSNINPTINFNINQPMDAYSFDTYLERSKGKLRRVIADGIDESVAFKKQMRGK